MLDKRSNLIIGKKESGKTTGLLFNEVKQYIEREDNLLFLDTKEEYYKTFYEELKNKNYDIKVLNLNNTLKSNSYNPLMFPYTLYKDGNKDKAIKLVKEISIEICKNEKEIGDPFWTNVSADYLMGIILLLFKEGKEEEINIGSVATIISQSENAIEGTTIIGKYLDKLDVLDPIYITLSSTAFAPKETRESILSVLRSKLNYYIMQENLLNLLCKNEIKVNELKEKTAIFILGKNNVSNMLIDQVISTNSKFTYILDNIDSYSRIIELENLLENDVITNSVVNVVSRNINDFEEVYNESIINKFNSLIKYNNEVELMKIGNYNEYPSIKVEKNSYFNLENTMKY